MLISFKIDFWYILVNFITDFGKKLTVAPLLAQKSFKRCILYFSTQISVVEGDGATYEIHVKT